MRAAILAVLIATPTSAQQVHSLICDLNGAPARMLIEVQTQQAFDSSADVHGNISGIFPVGQTIYTAGTVESASAYYQFRGENQFADFHGMGESFRVEWVLDPQNNGLWMIVNPFGPGPTQHFCAYQPG